jgi:hypothetical protein
LGATTVVEEALASSVLAASVLTPLVTSSAFASFVHATSG